MKVVFVFKGGAGSGHHGHGGRKGKRGGSTPGTGGGSVAISDAHQSVLNKMESDQEYAGFVADFVDEFTGGKQPAKTIGGYKSRMNNALYRDWSRYLSSDKWEKAQEVKDDLLHMLNFLNEENVHEVMLGLA